VESKNPSSPTPTIPALALRPKEAAQALGVSARTLWAWTAAREIPHLRRGAVLLYPVADLQRWLSEQAAGEARR